MQNQYIDTDLNVIDTDFNIIDKCKYEPVEKRDQSRQLKKSV